MFKKILAISTLVLSTAVFSACSAGGSAESTSGSESAPKSTTVAGDSAEAVKAAAGELLNEGELAPEMVLTDIDGNEYKLSDQKGKKVYVKFWASWCHVCTESMPELEELVAKENNFDIITVVSPGNYNELEKEEFKKWFAEKGYKIPVYFDESGKVMEEYGIRAFPTAAYIGSDGVLIGTLAGAVPNAKVIEAFDTLVK